MDGRWWEYLAKDLKVAPVTDRRIFARFRVEFPLKIMELKEQREGSGWVLDVSAKGVGFLTSQTLKPRQPLDLWLEIPDNHEPLYARGRVAWAELRGESEYKVGVTFDKIDFMGSGRALRSKLADSNG